MKTLIIAEKPSVGTAIARLLCGRGARRQGGSIESDDYVISWCFGHLLEQVEPDAYLGDQEAGGKSRPWRREDLPILPPKWQSQPRADKDARAQLKLLCSLIRRKDIDRIIHAGDPDREGQLLVDEVLHHAGNQKPVERLWVSAQDDASLRKGMASLRDNREFRGWAAAAIARSRADWLVGINLTRGYTLSSARGGTRALVTVGRVQTPTLKLVVDRDRAIERFKPVTYFPVEARFEHENGQFSARWKAQEGQDKVDEEGRLLDRALAEAIVERVRGQTGVIELCERKKKTESPPLAWSLAELTLVASQRFGFSAEETLAGCQALYETHKLTSYPRTDTGFLPRSQHGDAPAVLAAVAGNDPSLAALIEAADTRLQARAWNDARVTAHHGIIPTRASRSAERLPLRERRLYELIVRRYIALFYPPHVYEATRVQVEVAGERFETLGKRVLEAGWRVVLTGGRAPEETLLPAMQKGDPAHCLDASVSEAQTRPPEPYTEGTLIRAMANIARTVEDAAHRQALRDSDGIGTSATRATIIGELKRRHYLEARGKSIQSTPFGRSIIDALAPALTSAVQTAINERTLKAIEQGELEAFSPFMREQARMVSEHVEAINARGIALQAVPERKPGKAGRSGKARGGGQGAKRRPARSGGRKQSGA